MLTRKLAVRKKGKKDRRERGCSASVGFGDGISKKGDRGEGREVGNAILLLPLAAATNASRGARGRLYPRNINENERVAVRSIDPRNL